MKKVSVLITTYKRPKLVVEAIISCLQQTYPPHEIIIGDDSPDETTRLEIEKINTSSQTHIRYIHNVPSLGQTKNVNMLFDKASGDTSVLLHDDDLLLPIALEKMVDVFNSNASIDIAFGKQYVIFQNGEIDYKGSLDYNNDFYRHAEYTGQVLTPLEAGMGQQFPNNGYMIKSEIIKNIQFRRYIAEDYIGNGCEYDFGLQLGLHGYKMYFIDEYLAKYRLSDISMSKSSTDDSAYQAFRILKSVTVDTERARKIKARRLADKAPIAVVQAVDIGKKREAFEIYFSEWNSGNKLTIGGLKRLLYILFKFI
jgi:glycosyltransferase involved in cell wall biosynthesis